jgi:hypothetical protein
MKTTALKNEVEAVVYLSVCDPGACMPEPWFDTIEKCRVCGKLI